MGTDEMFVVYGGDRETFEATRPLLERLGGALDYLGEDPGLPSALDLAAVWRALQRLFEVGVEQGRGDHDISCVAELRAD